MRGFDFLRIICINVYVCVSECPSVSVFLCVSI